MATASHATGAFGRMLIEDGDSPHTFDGGSRAFEFLRESVRKQARIIGQSGIRGTLSRDVSRVREGAGVYGGEIEMYVTPDDMDYLLQYVLGYTESSTDVWVSDDTLPFFGVLIDRDTDAGGKIWEYKACKLDYWILQASASNLYGPAEPEMLRLRLGILCCEEDDTTHSSWPGSAPAIETTDAADAPYIFADSDGEIDINGIEGVAVESLTIVGRNFLAAKKVNSLLAHSIRPTDHVVQAVFRCPWNTTNQNLYGQDLAGAAATVKFVNGTVSTEWYFPKLVAPDKSPIIRGKQQIFIEVEGVAFGDGSTKEIRITNDHTV